MKKYCIVNGKNSNIYNFEGAYIFKSKHNNRNLILSRNGTNLVVDNNLANKIEKLDLDEDLILKLVQRGFVQYENSRKIVEDCQKVKPTFFLIDLTEVCNLKCVYCFRKLENKKMTEEKAIKICDFIKKYCITHKIKHIAIQPWGGEPLTEFELIKKIQDYFINTDIKVKMIIETNAVLINPEIAEELYKRDFGIGISIDGDKELHNKQRKFLNGNGSYDAVVKGIECLNNAGYIGKLGAICVITKKNYKEVRKIIGHLANNLHLKRIKFNLVRTNDKSLVLSEKEIKKFTNIMFDTVIEYLEIGQKIIISDIQDRISNIEYRANKSICISCGCMSGRKMISFNYKGDIFPCQMSDFETEKIGNIEDELDLIEMINRTIKTSELYKNIKTRKCTKCPWWYYCKGGCKSNRVYKYFFAKKNDKHECIYNRVIYQKIVDVILEKPEIIEKMKNNE